jgi:hypothetical protein
MELYIVSMWIKKNQVIYFQTLSISDLKIDFYGNEVVLLGEVGFVSTIQLKDLYGAAICKLLIKYYFQRILHLMLTNRSRGCHETKI